MMRTSLPFSKISFTLCSVAFCFQAVRGQEAVAGAESGGGIGWLFVAAVLIAIGAGAAVAIRMKMRESGSVSPSARKKSSLVYDWKPDFNSTPAQEDVREAEEKPQQRPSKRPAKSVSASEAALHGIDIDEVREKMEKIKFARLPINRIEELKPAKPFEALPASEDDELLAAIEDSDVEYVEDEEIRERALDVMAGYKNRNSVDALSQMALYDFSAILRSKAVMALADFNHPSVFEPVMLSCADPSREVRAAAARAMFKLSFKRADSWLRMAECTDEYRVSQIAKAAIEADFVDRSLERLVHSDVDYAYEALALIALLIKAGETDDIFEYLVAGADKTVRLAILRVFTLIRDDRVFAKIEELLAAEALSDEVEMGARELLESSQAMPA